MEKDPQISMKVLQNETLSLRDFLDFLQSNLTHSKRPKYYFELALLSDYFLILSMFSLKELSKRYGFQFHTVKRQVDDELHIIQIFIKKNQIESKMKVLIIQMDRIIKVSFQSWMFDQQKFRKTNQFVFDYVPYLYKKVSNSYSLYSLKQLSLSFQEKKNISCLRDIYLSRGLQSLTLSSKSKQSSESILGSFDFMRFFNNEKGYLKAKNFLQALSITNNLLKISSFLDIRSISRLSRSSRLIKKHFFAPVNLFYKNLYQITYGRTGFGINQMDWVKSLNKKRLQQSKKKIKPPSSHFSLTFRTH